MSSTSNRSSVSRSTARSAIVPARWKVPPRVRTAAIDTPHRRRFQPTVERMHFAVLDSAHAAVRINRKVALVAPGSSREAFQFLEIFVIARRRTKG